MSHRRFVLSLAGALAAVISLSPACFAAVPAGAPIVIAPQPGDEEFYYVNVEAPPALACTVGQKVFFAKLGDGPLGWTWTVDIDGKGNVLTPMAASNYPAGKNVIAGYICNMPGKVTVTWTVLEPPYGPEHEILQMTAVLPVVATADQAAARAFTEDDMNLQCSTNHLKGAKVDHLWIDGQFVLSEWSCGSMHGEEAFRMVGTKQLGQHYTRISDLDVDVSFAAYELVVNVSDMDRQTADRLVKLQDGARH